MASIRSHHTGDISKKKQGVRELRKKLMIPLITCDHLLQRDFPHMSLFLMHNPPGDGNCNFCALCFCLNHCGIHRSPETVQEEIVKCFLSNPNNIEGFPLELFMGMLWSEYLQSLAKNGTCKDHICEADGPEEIRFVDEDGVRMMNQSDSLTSYIDRLPNKLLEKVIFEVLSSSCFLCLDHTCHLYNQLCKVNIRFCDITHELASWILPRI